MFDPYMPQMPFASQPIIMPVNLPGKTRYNYVTSDGGPPNQGAVPTGSAFDQPTPATQFGLPGNCVAGTMHPFGMPNQLAGSPCVAVGPGWICTQAPPPAYYPGAPPQQHTCPGPPCPPQPAAKVPYPPEPTPAPTVMPSHAQHFTSSNEPAEEPLQGNRIKGQLATINGGKAGCIFFQRNVTIHLFTNNVMNKYPPAGKIVSTLPTEDITVQLAPCDMTIYEFIEQIDCRKRANMYPPYNQPGYGYPEHLIGIQQLLELGNNRFELGSRIMLTEDKARYKLGDIWPDSVGNAGQEKPVYIVRLPV